MKIPPRLVLLSLAMAGTLFGGPTAMASIILG